MELKVKNRVIFNFWINLFFKEKLAKVKDIIIMNSVIIIKEELVPSYETNKAGNATFVSYSNRENDWVLFYKEMGSTFEYNEIWSEIFKDNKLSVSYNLFRLAHLQLLITGFFIKGRNRFESKITMRAVIFFNDGRSFLENYLKDSGVIQMRIYTFIAILISIFSLLYQNKDWLISQFM